MRGCAGCTRWPYTLLGGPEASPPLTLAPRMAAEPGGGKLWLWMGMMDCVFRQSGDMRHSCSLVLLSGLRKLQTLRGPAQAPQPAPRWHSPASYLPWLQQLMLNLTAFPSCRLFVFLLISVFVSSAGSGSPAWEPSLGRVFAWASSIPSTCLGQAGLMGKKQTLPCFVMPVGETLLQ